MEVQEVRVTRTPSASRPRRPRVLPSLANVLLLLVSVAGLVLFARGFFPVKPLLPGYGTPGSYDKHVSEPESKLGAPPFDRLVFVLIDALRSDFAFGPKSNMNFVASLVKSGKGIPFTARAQAPTVTLPRLKALTTGSNPTFLDAMLNIAEDSKSVLENVDSWVRQFAIGDQLDPKVAPRRKVVFAGDDTWLRLFPPSWFVWSEGVSSFFVTDTVTVDTNVTRHLDRFLSPSLPPSDEWDALILHYLGMDHVGHLGGPESELMGPKQAEMDDVVKRLYQFLDETDGRDDRRSLLVVIGDHGMTDTGNHGGSSERETSSALLLASPSMPPSPSNAVISEGSDSPYLLGEVVSQIDLVPTLSVLFELGIPTNSMGRVISSALERFFPRESATFQDRITENVRQIERVLETASPGAAGDILCEIAPEMCRGGQKVAVDVIANEDDQLKFLQLARDRLLSTFGDSKIRPMLAGLLLLIASAMGLVVLAREYVRQEDGTTNVVVAAALVLYLGGFFATSFIEEEHEIWFFGTVSVLVGLALRRKISIWTRVEFLLVAASVRLMRGWSHNGQKDFLDTSITSQLVTDRDLTVKLALATVFYLGVNSFVQLCYASRPSDGRKYTLPRLLFKALSLSVLFVLVLIQLAILIEPFGSSPVKLSSKARARASYTCGAAALLALKLMRDMEPDMSEYLEELKLATVSCILLSVTRPTNFFIFFLMWRQYELLKKRKMSPILVSALIVAFQHIAFYATGGSRSLASVDLSQAYNGVTSYDVRTVALLTYLSNFSGPIFFSFASYSLFTRNSSSPAFRQAHQSHLVFTSAFHSLTLFALAASATHFRTHLFTWTVFSPALLYKGIWSTFLHIGTNLLLVKLVAL